MSFYTAKGDDGTTGLLGEGRVQKNDARIEALGTLDEASAAIGMARTQSRAGGVAEILLEVQRDLYQVMAELAATPEHAAKFRGIDAPRVEWLEKQTDRFGKAVDVPSEFIIPGDSPGEAALSLARAVVRRAERRMVDVGAQGALRNAELPRYINRLSSLLFVLELLENKEAGRSTTLAKGA